MVEGENGQPMAVGARELVRMESPRPGVFNGEDFQKIDKAEIVHEITEVVEIAFVDDAVVLAWLFPQRRPRSGGRTLSATGGVACRGAPVWASDAAASRQQLRHSQHVHPFQQVVAGAAWGGAGGAEATALGGRGL